MEVLVLHSTVVVCRRNHLNEVRDDSAACRNHKITVLLLKYFQRILAVLKSNFMFVHLAIDTANVDVGLSEFGL
jgi:hypothetical protein